MAMTIPSSARHLGLHDPAVFLRPTGPGGRPSSPTTSRAACWRRLDGYTTGFAGINVARAIFIAFEGMVASLTGAFSAALMGTT